MFFKPEDITFKVFAGVVGWLIGAIQTHGMLAVVLGVALETVVIPIPSPLILMAAGFILITAESISQALLQSFWISVVAAAAQTIGSYIVYGIAFFGGRPLIESYEKWHGVSWDEVVNFRENFEKNGREEVTLFILRAVPIVPLSVVSGVAGAIKMDFRKFTVFTFLGAIPRNVVLALLGWQLAGAYEALAYQLNSVETAVSVFLVVLIAGYFLAHRFSRKFQKILH
jgi:membrane protein DedA with SNARE-associated domain